ncbi:hypothetical protein O1611_g5647 [Lasiodiplodia mahajangana]|uniref:Uncharacterized protein n=1 Tax=Lasiodiplodia mahajangana TaxID=1108764 RepID=A0ACC2JKW7_9PEZI|nr:hypothetical protein O1611_g5647 [Lasiodiplodia mahajangana]
MAAKVFADHDLKLFEYFGGQSIKDRTEGFNLYLQSHSALAGTGSVSPKAFQRLFTEHIDPLLDTLTYVKNELVDILEQRKSEPDGTAKKEFLAKMATTGTATKVKYERLFKRMLDVAAKCTPRVYWTKHTNEKTQEELADFVQRKQLHITDLVFDEINVGVKTALEAVNAALAKAVATKNFEQAPGHRWDEEASQRGQQHNNFEETQNHYQVHRQAYC